MKTISLAKSSAQYHSENRVSLLSRFMTWSNAQQHNRLLWLGIIIAFHGCILTPLTVMVVLFAGTNLTLFVVAIVAMGMSLVTNLAAMPTKITLPVFALSILIDLAVIAIAMTHGFNITSTYI